MAQNPFDDDGYGSDLVPKAQSSANPFDDDEYGKPPRTRGAFEALNDLVIEGANAAAGGVSSAANFFSPGNKVSSFIDENIIKAGEAKQSDVVRGAKQRLGEGIQNADGALGELGAVGSYILENPGLAAAQAAGSFAVPGGVVKGGGALARLGGASAQGAVNAGRAGGVAAGAAMAGGDAAGTAYDLSKNAGATEEQAIAAGRQASVIPSLVGGVTGAFGAERLLAGARGFTGGATSRALKTGLSEAGQEGFEEGITQFEGQRAAMPYDPSIDPTKGVAAAAGMGAAMGFVPGAALGALDGASSGGRQQRPPEDQAAPPAAAPTQQAVDPLTGEVAQVAAEQPPVAEQPAAAPAPAAPPEPEITPVTPIPSRPSEAMGIDPNAGPLSRAAAQAVDSGVSPVAPTIQPAPRYPVDLPQANLADRTTEELREVQRNAQDPAIRRVVSDELRRRREAERAAIPDPMQPVQAATLPLETQPGETDAPQTQAVDSVAQTPEGASSQEVIERNGSNVLGGGGRDSQQGGLSTAEPAGLTEGEQDARRTAEGLRGGDGASTGAGSNLTGAGVGTDVGRVGGRGTDTADAQPDVPRADSSAGTSPAGAVPALTRPRNWRGNAIPARKVARDLGIPTEGKRLAQIVAEIDAADEKADWQTFEPSTQTLGIPRAAMPQIKSEHRGAMVNFLKGRGVTSEQSEVDPGTLKPTQAEFSIKKVEKATKFDGPDRSILISSDNHVVDGHHQWLAKMATGQPVKVIRLNAPIAELLPLVSEFPSATTDESTNVQNPPQGTAGTRTEAPPAQAPAPAGGDASAAAGSAGAGQGAGVRADGVKRQRPTEESQQDRSIREWTENYDRIANTDDLSTVETKDIVRAIAWASRKKQSEARKGWDGGEPNQNLLQALDAEIARLRAEELRRATPAPAGVPAEAGGRGEQADGVSTAAPSATPAPQTAPQQDQPIQLGRNGIPIAEGGKPFKTQKAAREALKQQAGMRVVSAEGGFVLAPKTPAQIAAQQKAAKRLGGVGNAGVPMAAHELLASRGGLNKNTMADIGFDRNQRVGAKWLFAANGGLTMEQATEALQQAGYMTGTDQNEAMRIISRSARGNPVYTPEGFEQMAQAEAETRFADHLAAQQEVDETADDFDPFGPTEGYTEDDLELSGFDTASDAIKTQVRALRDQAEVLGIDTEIIMEDAARATADQPEQAYYEQALRNLTEAIAQSTGGRSTQPAGGDEQGSEGTAQQRGADGRGSDDGAEGAPAGLTAPSRADVEAQQARTERAGELDQREQVRRESEVGDTSFMTGFDGDGRQDSTGELFSIADAEDRQPQTETPAFKRWFAGSKVVDADGNPLVVYHGTTADVNAFDLSFSGSDGVAYSAPAIFATTDQRLANDYATNKFDRAISDAMRALQRFKNENPGTYDERYEAAYDAVKKAFRGVREEGRPEAGGGANVMPLFMSLKNPLVVDARGQYFMQSMPENIAKAVAEGRDGLIVKNVRDQASPASDFPADVFIAFRPEQIKSAIGNSGAFDPSNPDIRYSIADGNERDLVAMHNLTADNLLYADSMGGIPAPSIGITKIDTPFNGFGEITLIAPSSMVDPATGTAVFDRDAWTARFPTMNFKKVKAKVADAFYERMKPAKQLGDDGGQFMSMIWESVKNESNQSPDKVFRWFDSYTAPKMLYAKEVLGKEIKVPMRNAQRNYDFSADKQLLSFWKKNGPEILKMDRDMSGPDFYNSDQFKAFSNEVRDAIGRAWADRESNPQSLASLRKIYLDDMFGRDGLLYPASYNQMVKDFGKVGQKEIDRIKLGEAVSKVVKSDDPGYQRWVKSLVEPLFEPPTITVRGREVEPTLENIVDAMTVGATQGAEKSLTFGPGKTAAMLGKRYKSMAEIKADRDRVVSQAQESENKKATDAILEQYRTKVSQFYRYTDWRGNVDTWAANDASMEALAKAGKAGGTNADIRQALIRAGFKSVDQATVDLARESIQAIRNTATDYFEAKPQRAVKLNEFRAAVVPKGVRQEVKDVLAKNGIEVVEFTKAEGAREAAIKKAAKRVDKADKGVLFKMADQSPTQGITAYAPAPQAQRDIAGRIRDAINKFRERNGSGAILWDAVVPPDGEAGATARNVARIAKRLFGRDVIYVKFDGPALFNGAVSKLQPGTIFLNIDSERPLMAVLGHELLHELAKSNPGVYRNLSQRLNRVMRNQNIYSERLKAKYRTQGQPFPADILEELEADIVGDNFMDPEFWNEVAKGQPGMFRAVANQIMRWLDRIAQRITRMRPFGTEMYLTDIAAARSAVADAMREFSQTQGQGERSGSDAVMSLAKSGVPSKQEVIGALQKHPWTRHIKGIKRVALVGSFARSEQRQDSDIDVLVEVSGNAKEMQDKYRMAGQRHFMRNNIQGKDDSAHPNIAGRRVDVYVTNNLESAAEGPMLQIEDDLFTIADRPPQTETAAFKRWFAGSKVVDAEGKPLVVYHGTERAGFTQFDPNKAGENTGRDFSGIYFTNAKLGAETYSGTKREARLMDEFDPYDSEPGNYPVYLRMQNPYVIDFDGRGWDGSQADGDFDDWFNMDEVVQRAKDDGHDGVIAENVSDEGRYGQGYGWGDKTFVVFNPTQIKSATQNTGAFDPENPDIRFSIASPQQTSSWAAPENTRFDDFVFKTQDKLIDLKRVIESIKKSTGQLTQDINAYLQEELFHGRAAKRVENFGKKELEPLMNTIRMAGLTINDVEEYLHARHAPEANKVIAQRNPGVANLQDGGSGMKTADALAYMASLTPDMKRKLDAVAARVDRIIADTRQLYVDYGLEDQAVVDGWGSLFKHYIPLQREDKDNAGGGMGIGQGFSVKGKETKGRTGSTRKVVDILANIALQREKLIVRGEKNRVAQALIGLAQANPNPDFWEVRSQPPTERVYDPKTDKVVERPDMMFKMRPNVLTAKVKDSNGNVTEQAVVFNEDNDRAVRLAKAMKNIDAGTLEGLLATSAKITRYFASINTQYNPIFGAVNLVRDVQGAMINLGDTPLADQRLRIAKDTTKALAGIYTDIRKTRKGGQATSVWSQLWEEFQEVGGKTGFRELFKTSADRAEGLKGILNPDGWMDSKMGRLLTANGTLRTPLSKVKKGADVLFDWLSDYNEAMENGVRLAAYKAAKDKGMSAVEAASLAKNLTVNFNRKGQVGMQMGAVYAFFNAAMQGTARMGQALLTMEDGNVRTLRLNRTGKQVVYGGLILGSVQALALAMAGFDEEDPPEFMRDRNLIIPTGGKSYVSIPMPLGYHVIPGIGRHMTEFVMSGFEKPAQRAVSMFALFADAFNPIGNAGMSMQTLAPTVLDPLVALTENKDWSGRPIARTSMNPATPGPSLYKDTASTVGKFISESINTLTGGNEYVAGALSPTPDQIDYLIGQLTGGVGREFSKAEQTLLSTARGEELPTYKIPLVGRFVGNAEGQASEGSAFYSNTRRLNELETELKGLRADGRGQEAAELARSRPESRLILMANATERQVQKLRREKRKLIEDGASREQVRAIEARITETMSRLNRAVERLEEA